MAANGFGVYQTDKTEDIPSFVRRAVDFVEQVLELLPKPLLNNKTVEELRKKALEAVTAQPAAISITSRMYYQRRADVKTYVVARAQGVCEACGCPAPFTRKNGAPYLEPHHIERLADGGLDHPRHVAAVCPNCHREIHYGSDGEKINERARQNVKRKEEL
jgi:5-methylcytosine-specific restriction protein A